MASVLESHSWRLAVEGKGESADMLSTAVSDLTHDSSGVDKIAALSAAAPGTCFIGLPDCNLALGNAAEVARGGSMEVWFTCLTQALVAHLTLAY